MKNQGIEGVNSCDKKSPEFQEAETTGMRVAFLNELEALSPESANELRIVADNLLQRNCIILPHVFLRGNNLNLITEFKDFDDKKLKVLYSFLESLCVPETPPNHCSEKISKRTIRQIIKDVTDWKYNRL